MSEEWTEVEAHGVKIRYAPSGDAGGYRMETKHGSRWIPGQSIRVQAVLFELGMEAARQEIRERVEQVRDDEWEAVQDEWELRSRREQAAWANRRVALNDVLEILSPPDSETES